MRRLLLLSIVLYLTSCGKDKESGSSISFQVNGISKLTRNIQPIVQGNELVSFTGEFNDGTSIGFNLIALSSQVPGNYNFREGRMFPLQFVSFTAQAENYKPKLKWVTNAETNLSKYEIERSLSGNDFTKIGEVAATNTTSLANYEFFDTTLTTTAKTYYRLKVIDVNGQFIYSQVILVNIIYVAYYTEGSVQYKGYDGNFSIVNYDKSGHVFTGNFSFDIKNNSGIIKAIRNGTISIRY